MRLDSLYSHSKKNQPICIWRFSRGTFIRWLIRVIALGLQLTPLLNLRSQSSCSFPEMHWFCGQVQSRAHLYQTRMHRMQNRELNGLLMHCREMQIDQYKHPMVEFKTSHDSEETTLKEAAIQSWLTLKHSPTSLTWQTERLTQPPTSIWWERHRKSCVTKIQKT